jgi:hypothetical protein
MCHRVLMPRTEPDRRPNGQDRSRASRCGEFGPRRPTQRTPARPRSPPPLAPSPPAATPLSGSSTPHGLAPPHQLREVRRSRPKSAARIAFASAHEGVFPGETTRFRATLGAQDTSAPQPPPLTATVPRGTPPTSEALEAHRREAHSERGHLKVGRNPRAASKCTWRLFPAPDHPSPEANLIWSRRSPRRAQIRSTEADIAGDSPA